MIDKPMSAADYKARADATRRENEAADRLEAEEEQRRLADLVPAGAEMAKCSTCR